LDLRNLVVYLFRAGLHRSIAELRRAATLDFQALFFGIWRGSLGDDLVQQRRLHSHHSALISIPFAKKTLALSAHKYRKLLKHDRNQHVIDVIDSARIAIEHDDTKTLFGIIRRLKGFTRRPPRGVKLDDGSPARSPSQVAVRWQQYFSILLKGKVTDDVSI